jgi:hypothetical protein
MESSPEDDPRKAKRIQEHTADQRRYNGRRQVYSDQSDDSRIMGAIAALIGTRRPNFQQLKKVGDQLCERANIPRPGREEKRRKELFIGWLNSNQAHFEPFLGNVTTFPARSEFPQDQNDQSVSPFFSPFFEDDYES